MSEPARTSGPSVARPVTEKVAAAPAVPAAPAAPAVPAVPAVPTPTVPAATQTEHVAKEESRSTSPKPPTIYYDDPPEEEIVEEPRDAAPPKTGGSNRCTARPSDEEVKEGGRRTPAYVAPIPKVGPIRTMSAESIMSADRPNIPQYATANLVGKRIDEFGDIVDVAGNVLGRVAGDLPAMVGRRILNHRGDVVDDDGELLGYVAEVKTQEAREINEEDDNLGGPSKAKSKAKAAGTATPKKEPESLNDYVQRQRSAFRVDENGNILDGEGNVVGSFHDNLWAGPKSDQGDKAAPPDGEQGRSGSPPAREKERERTPNAQSFRKEDESPSDIFLDVKSTTEGIQLTVRIPTVFPGAQPRVHVS